MKTYLLVAALLLVASCSVETNPQTDEFAKCITDKGAVMYGALGCTHCQNNKELFGPSFKYVNYIECNPNGPGQRAAYCIEQGIDRYPTWAFGDGSREIGEQNFYDLYLKTGCEPPKVG